MGNQTIGDELFKVSVDIGDSGSRTVTVSGDAEVVKSVDILAITKEVLRPESEETEITVDMIKGIEERQKAQDAKIEKLDERLDKMGEKLDRLFKKLDEFEKTDPNRLRDIPTVPNIPGWTYTGIKGVDCGGWGHGPWDTAPDEETRKRVWEYWHNPDGTPKIVSGITPEQPEMTMTGGLSYFGFDRGEKDTTTQMTLDGSGNVVSATERTSPYSAPNPMA